MRYHAIVIHIDYVIPLYVLVYKLNWTHEDSHFSPQMVLVVLRVEIHAFWIFVMCWWSASVWVHGFFFLICVLVQVIFLSLVVLINFWVTIFLWLDPFSNT
jgi:hypothetical protein